MTVKKNRNKNWLLKVAKAVAKELKVRCRDTGMKIRIPYQATSTNTSGWSASIGNLGKNKTNMQIWLDRFTGHQERKLWATFYGNRQQIKTLSNKVKSTIIPVREITTNDTKEKKYVFLPTKLPRQEFGNAILEKHGSGQTYLGIYEFSSPSLNKTEPRFVALAVSFFESVAKAIQKYKNSNNDESDDYTHIENRKQVRTHLLRERNRHLATQCKCRDNYICRVCGFNFKKYYGKHGKEFAEAHHLIPLNQFRGKVKTRLEDLITVCANCHRMLHLMEGKRNDFLKLQRSIAKRHH